MAKQKQPVRSNKSEDFGTGIVDTSPKKSGIKPKTPNQQLYADSIRQNTITISYGPPGTGKTMLGIGIAWDMFVAGGYEKIVITRPIVEAGENMGFLPGSFEDKIHPYLLPIFDELGELVGGESGIKKLVKDKKIEIVPLALMRGRSFHNAIVVADECQNAKFKQLRMLLSRLGRDSKMIINGDLTQSDLHTKEQGGLEKCITRLNGMSGLQIIKFDMSDILRSPFIRELMERLGEDE